MPDTRPDPDFSCAGMPLKGWLKGAKPDTEPEKAQIDAGLKDLEDDLNAAFFGVAPKQTPKAKRNRRRP